MIGSKISLNIYRSFLLKHIIINRFTNLSFQGVEFTDQLVDPVLFVYIFMANDIAKLSSKVDNFFTLKHIFLNVLLTYLRKK